MTDHGLILTAAVGEIHGEARPGQQAMADAVADTLEGGVHLLVQAVQSLGEWIAARFDKRAPRNRGR